MSIARPVRTQIGEIYGRDAIYLDEFSQDNFTLRFIGEISGRLCQGESVPKDAWMQYWMEFHGVYAYDCREVDVCMWSHRSSFDEIEDSEWLPSLRLNRRTQEHARIRHYIWATYDLVYQIAAFSFEFVILGERPIPPPPRRKGEPRRRPPK